MEMTEMSVRQLARMMRGIESETENGLAILLVLETEENAQEFFAWCKGMEKEPTPQECFEKALEIRMENGPDPEE